MIIEVKFFFLFTVSIYSCSLQWSSFGKWLGRQRKCVDRVAMRSLKNTTETNLVLAVLVEFQSKKSEVCDSSPILFRIGGDLLFGLPELLEKKYVVSFHIPFDARLSAYSALSRQAVSKCFSSLRQSDRDGGEVLVSVTKNVGLVGVLDARMGGGCVEILPKFMGFFRLTF